MKKVIIVKTGESYSDNSYKFDKESDAIEFFKYLNKGTKVTRDYIQKIGYVYSDSISKNDGILQYADYASIQELEIIKIEEEEMIQKEQAEREAKEQTEKAKEEVKE